MIGLVWLMVFNVNNISVISWLSVLLVEETECPEKTTDLSQVRGNKFDPVTLTFDI
jgi:hypothetical protein